MIEQEQSVFIGGPMDGAALRTPKAVTSVLFDIGGMIHRYRLRGSRDEPVRNADGHRIMDHCKIARAIKSMGLRDQ